MSGRTATWKQPVHSTFVLTVNDQVGRLPLNLLLHDSFAVAWRSFVCDCRVTRRRLFWTVFPFVAWSLVTLV